MSGIAPILFLVAWRQAGSQGWWCGTHPKSQDGIIHCTTNDSDGFIYSTDWLVLLFNLINYISRQPRHGILKGKTSVACKMLDRTHAHSWQDLWCGWMRTQLKESIKVVQIKNNFHLDSPTTYWQIQQEQQAEEWEWGNQCAHAERKIFWETLTNSKSDEAPDWARCSTSRVTGAGNSGA